LEIHPKKVPNFLKLYKNNYMDETRKWLADNFNKGLVYIPARAFMELGEGRYNGPIGPAGFSIAVLNMVDDRAHAVVAFNGGILWDNGNSREKEYDYILGYYIVYDLRPAKPKWIKQKKAKKTKRGKR
jgi:hypothetical protein